MKMHEQGSIFHPIVKLQEVFNFFKGNANILLTYIKQTSTINVDKCWNSHSKTAI